MAMMQMGERGTIKISDDTRGVVESYVSTLADAIMDFDSKLIKDICHEFFLDICNRNIMVTHPDRDIDVEFDVLINPGARTVQVQMDWILITWGEVPITYSRVTRAIEVGRDERKVARDCAQILSDIAYSTRFAVWKMAESWYLKETWRSYENILFDLGCEIS